jgi:glycosyltransferase involved in cell wall biosynthesis
MVPAPDISVVIPAYNYSKYILETLRSVEFQTFTNWECIIVDDGSTDDTAEVVKAMTSRDDRFKYVYQNNKGLPGARNTGIREAKGKYLQFLDADDLIEKGKLQAHFETLEKEGRDTLVYGSIKHFKENPTEYNLRVIPKLSGQLTLLPRIMDDNIFLVSAPMLSKETAIKAGSFDESLKSLEDWDFWIRCLLKGTRFLYLEQPNTATLIRSHGSNMSSNHKRMWEARKIVRKKIDGYLSNHSLSASTEVKEARRKNSYLLQKDSGLFDICFGSAGKGLIKTLQAGISHASLLTDLKDAGYWLRQRILKK